MREEPREVRVEHPGEDFTEQVTGARYCTYTPREPDLSGLTQAEKAEYMTLRLRGEKPGGVPYTAERWSFEAKILDSGDERAVTYRVPMSRVPWALPGEPLEPGSLERDIRSFIEEHVDLPDDRLYDVLAAWVTATWTAERWTVVPYLMVAGPIKSGKTRLLEVLRYISYRGILSSNISESALFRCVEAWRPTLLLDEAEIYAREQRADILNLLNSGYRRGQYAIRVRNVDRGIPVVDSFEVFGFKALAGTGGFTPAIESRCIRVQMEKNVRPVRVTVNEARALELRSRLLLYRWRRLSEVSEDSEDTQKAVGVELGADGRHLELYGCLLASSVEGRSRILSYAREGYGSSVDEEATSIEATVVEAVLRLRGSLEAGKFGTEAVTLEVNRVLPEGEGLRSRSVSRILSRLGFQRKRLTGGKSGWLWNEAKVRRLAARYSAEDTSRQTSLSSLSSLKRSVVEVDSSGKAPGLAGDIVTLVETLWEMENGEAVRDEDLAERVQGVKWWLGSHFEKVLEVAIRDGHVFRPRPGYVKTTGGKG